MSTQQLVTPFDYLDDNFESNSLSKDKKKKKKAADFQYYRVHWEMLRVPFAAAGIRQVFYQDVFHFSIAVQ